MSEESFVDMLAAGCDERSRYDERLEQDVIAVPIGPQFQHFATAGRFSITPADAISRRL